MPSDSAASTSTAPHPVQIRRWARLREKLRTYRRWVIGLAAALVLTLAGGTYALLDVSDDPDAVLLGTGKAGLKTMTADSIATTPPPRTTPEDMGEATPPPRATPAGTGEASYYGDELAGRPTASGEPFNPNRLTAAHRTLPLGSKVRVTNIRNGESVVVRVNDRGPYSGQRVIDLSYAAAREIGMLRSGTAPVRIELIS